MTKIIWYRVAMFWVVCILVVVGSSVLLAKSAHADGMTESELDGHMQNYYNQVVDAIYLAEGGAKTRHPFGILSVKCDGYDECREVCYRTVRNNYHRWIKAGRQGDYIQFLANRYCPVGADNDPKGLNRHWYGNVTRLIERG
jgi:hypothetical protein